MTKEDTKKTTGKFIDDDTEKKIIEKLITSSRVKQNGGILPLRRNIDYTSIARKTIMAGRTGFFCLKCGFTNEDSDYEHSEDECLLAGVHLP